MLFMHIFACQIFERAFLHNQSRVLFIIININTLQSPAAAPATSQVNTNNHSSQPAAAAAAAAPAPRVVSTAFKCKYLIQSSVCAQAEPSIVSVN